MHYKQLACICVTSNQGRWNPCSISCESRIATFEKKKNCSMTSSYKSSFEFCKRVLKFGHFKSSKTYMSCIAIISQIHRTLYRNQNNPSHIFFPSFHLRNASSHAFLWIFSWQQWILKPASMSSNVHDIKELNLRSGFSLAI